MKRVTFHAGTRIDGPVARQAGETKMEYITRRRRWFQRLTSLDGETTVSENILADYLLDCSGLTFEHKLMIRTVCGNRRKFDEIALALRQQHPRVHLRESQSRRNT
eukprot:5089484-Prorocentrum_lima.AAC.1